MRRFRLSLVLDGSRICVPACPLSASRALSRCTFQSTRDARAGQVGCISYCRIQNSAQALCHLIAILLLAPTLTVHAANSGGTINGIVASSNQKPVPGAIVYIGTAPQKSRGNVSSTIVDASRGRLLPRIQIARSGDAMILQNSDPTLHIVRLEEIGARGKPRPPLTIAMPYAGFEQRFQLPEYRDTRLIRILGQNGERHAVAYVAVIPHAWAAITDAGGRFEIGHVPAGRYPIYVWHETLGTLTGRVRVTRDRAATVQFEFPQSWTALPAGSAVPVR